MKMQLASIALLTILGTEVSAAELITNGSFESPTVPIGGFTSYFGGSTAIPGWTVIALPIDNVTLFNTSYVAGNIPFPALHGNQWLDLSGTSEVRFTGVQQTISTTPGQIYDLSFYVGNIRDLNFGVSSTVHVVQDNNPGTIITAINDSFGDIWDWKFFTSSFVASGLTTTLSFVNDDRDPVTGLDLVSVTPRNGTAVPEPSSLMIMIGAMGLFGLVTRKRHRQVDRL
jgi:hypothetical protein